MCDRWHTANRKPGLLPDKVRIGLSQLDSALQFYFLQINSTIPGAHD